MSGVALGFPVTELNGGRCGGSLDPLPPGSEKRPNTAHMCAAFIIFFGSHFWLGGKLSQLWSAGTEVQPATSTFGSHFWLGESPASQIFNMLIFRFQ